MKITRLKIYTAQLKTQLQFYRDVLQIPVKDANDKFFILQIGYSLLEFHQTEMAVPYHIAFHIGAEQENQAVKWLQERVPILKNERKNIVDFPAWNAKSIYFYDKDQNVIEFISRKHLHTSNENFSEKSLLGIAEIGLATSQVSEFFRFLNGNFGLEIYFGKPDVFCAIGDDNGLLITVDQTQKTWFPTQDTALPAGFHLEFKHHGKTFKLNYEKEKLSIV